jgi:metallophosphoesterase (TIGR00282 family)
MKVLFIGDIVGKGGRTATKSLLPAIVSRYKIDLVIANGENAAGGFGITDKIATEILAFGVHLITTGNHVWDKKEFIPQISKMEGVIRPLNYPPDVPGFGSAVCKLSNGLKAAVINISGRVFMSSIDCPFRTADAEAGKLSEETKVIIIDMHGEATSEKIAFGYLGPCDSVIGVEKEQIIERFLTNMPTRFEVAKGPVCFSAVVLEIDENTGKASAIQRLQLNYP